MVHLLMLFRVSPQEWDCSMPPILQMSDLCDFGKEVTLGRPVPCPPPRFHWLARSLLLRRPLLLTALWVWARIRYRAWTHSLCSKA